jgi:hypothetical protein
LLALRLAIRAQKLWEVWRYFASGWIEDYFLKPSFHFTYLGFGWVRPLPGWGVHAVFALLGLAAAGIAIGPWRRLAAAVFAVGFTYQFLLEQARYLNHFYLICLLAFLLALVPDGRHVPAWALWLLRAQVGIVYVFAGLAKLNADWLAGEPVRSWLAERALRPAFGPWLADERLVWLVSWGGLLLDLLVVPGLLWRRTRAVAFVAASAFHLGNAWLFSIGVFPWLMLAATTIFFAPDWPRALLGRPPAPPAPTPSPTSTWSQRAALALAALWIVVQVLVPLRHWLYPGNVAWTEEGHRFAWRMKLRSKKARAAFVVVDRGAQRLTRVAPADVLEAWQADEMSARPDMILQFAHHLAGERGGGVEVRAEVEASLNARPWQPLIDPDIDLARVRRDLWPASWILPFRR